jgi:hypothetical protein
VAESQNVRAQLKGIRTSLTNLTIIQASASGSGITTVSTLPTPVVGLRGRVYLLTGANGVEDALYICEKNSLDVYVWKEI